MALSSGIQKRQKQSAGQLLSHLVAEQMCTGALQKQSGCLVSARIRYKSVVINAQAKCNLVYLCVCVWMSDNVCMCDCIFVSV